MAKGYSSNKGNNKKDGHLRKERTEWIKIEGNILDFPSSNKSLKSYLFVEAKI